MVESALYIVATPIGNLDDISKRALDTLAAVYKIAAEDTRHSKRLLEHYHITTELFALHEHNEEGLTNKILDFIANGHAIALISDAGTPLISDPGYKLVAKAIERNIKVIPIPGPCALIAALSASGIATDKFFFTGFLPVKVKAKKDYISSVLMQDNTVILYEAPHRLLSTLKLIQELCGDGQTTRQIVLARELTKKFETIIKASIGELVALVEKDPMQQKGEIVLIIEGHDKSRRREKDIDASAVSGGSIDVVNTLKVLHDALPLAEAVRLATQITKLKKNQVYKYMLSLQGS